MKEIIFLIEEAVEGGFTARALGEAIFTEGDTIDELKTNIREAVACHFEEGNLPQLVRLHIVKDELLIL
jgi:predicted RNase H-like HicB family nuclease